MKPWALITFCALLLAPLPAARAADTFAWRPQDGGFSFYLARLSPDEDADHLHDANNAFAMGAILTLPYRDHIDIDVGFDFYYRKYATPPLPTPAFGTVSDQMALDTTGITVGPTFFIGDRQSRLFCGAGAGLYYSRLRLSGSLFGMPGNWDEQTSIAPGFQIHLGADLRIGAQTSLGITVRRLWLQGDFDDLSHDNADIGGSVVGLAARWWIPAH